MLFLCKFTDYASKKARPHVIITTMEDVDKIVDNLKEIVTGERTVL